MINNKSKNRNDYFRCPLCGELFLQEDLSRNDKTGAYICQNNCQRSFDQPPYESPLNDDTSN